VFKKEPEILHKAQSIQNLKKMENLKKSSPPKDAVKQEQKKHEKRRG